MKEEAGSAARPTGGSAAPAVDLARLTRVAILTALSFLLTRLEIPLFPVAAPWLKYDPGDVALLIGGFALGPLAALEIAVLRSLLMVAAGTTPLGTIFHLIAGVAFGGAACVIYRRNKTKAVAGAALAVGTVALVFAMMLANRFLVPLFFPTMFPTTEALVAYTMSVVPVFNLAKGGIDGVLTFVIYKRVSPLLK